MNGFINYLTYFGIIEKNNVKEFDFHTHIGKIRSSFIFLESGNAKYETKNETLYLNPGDTIFIPSGAKYSSHYRGDKICYKNFVCVFSPDFPSNQSNSAVFPMQTVNFKSVIGENEITEICKLYSSGEYITAMARFYSVYEKLLDNMNYTVVKNALSPIEPAVSYISEHFSENFKIEQLAELCLMSESYFFRLFEKEYGCSPIEYKNRLRIKKAISMLENDKYTVSKISEYLGFSTDEYFSRTFKKITGRTPTSYKK